VGLATGVKS